MNRIFITLLSLVVVAGLLTGCSQSSAQFGAGDDTTTFTVKDKHRDWLASEEDHLQWVVKTTKGKTYAAYYGHFEMDFLDRPEQYKKLKEGHTYTCELYGYEAKALHHWKVVKNCEDVG